MEDISFLPVWIVLGLCCSVIFVVGFVLGAVVF